MKCPRCQHENPPRAKFCLTCGGPFKVGPEFDAPTASYTDLQRALSEALEERTATREILRAISSSPTNVEPVFDTILPAAVRLGRAAFGAIYRYDGELVEFAGSHNLPDDLVARFRRQFPARPHRGLLAMRAIMDDAVIHVGDLEQDPEFRNQQFTHAAGIRSMVAVPLRRGDVTIGAIAVGGAEVGRFADTLVDLLKTFAAQAVIAIQNVRLFKELEARNQDLTEALEQQTATAEILRVISNSPTDLQPVLDAMAERAARLCAAYDAIILQLDGEVLRRVAHHGPIAAPPALAFPATRDTVGGRTVLDRRPIHVADLQVETKEFPVGSAAARQLGSRTVLGVPLLREGAAIGVIYIRRTEVQPFTEAQIALLQTFADQAVIAIESVRLFTELQDKNRALTEAHTQVTEALEQQTATREILRVISSSPTDLQPVLDAVVKSASRLCNSLDSVIFRLDGSWSSTVGGSG